MFVAIISQCRIIFTDKLFDLLTLYKKRYKHTIMKHKIIRDNKWKHDTKYWILFVSL